MYNVMSSRAEEFISDEEILDCLSYEIGRAHV